MTSTEVTKGYLQGERLAYLSSWTLVMLGIIEIALRTLHGDCLKSPRELRCARQETDARSDDDGVLEDKIRMVPCNILSSWVLSRFGAADSRHEDEDVSHETIRLGRVTKKLPGETTPFGPGG